MTSLLDCQIFSLVKNFGWNMKKMVVGLAYWLDHLADQIWLATVFFRFLSLQIIQNVKKTSCRFCQPFGRPDHPPDWIFTSDRFFYVLDYLELIWKKKFNQKNLWTVIWQLMTSSCTVNFEIFLVKNFFKNYISNFLRSLSFFEIAVIF